MQLVTLIPGIRLEHPPIELISPTACPLTRCLLCELVKAINDKLKSDAHTQNEPATIYTGPPVIRVTLASVEETSTLLSRGLDFYGATYFPTETPHPAAQPLAKYKNNRWETDVRARICLAIYICTYIRYARFPRVNLSKSISIYRGLPTSITLLPLSSDQLSLCTIQLPVLETLSTYKQINI